MADASNHEPLSRFNTPPENWNPELTQDTDTVEDLDDTVTDPEMIGNYRRPAQPTNQSRNSLSLWSACPLRQTGVPKRLVDLAAELEADIEPLPRELRPRRDEWCAERGLDPDADTTRRTLARQAVFSTFLKVVLTRQHHDLPPLNDTDANSSIRDRFQQAADKTGREVFIWTVLDDIVEHADTPVLEPICSSLYGLRFAVSPASEIGYVYEHLFGKDSRQQLGQFHTPLKYGELMRAWVGAEAENLLDPGIGAAALSAPSGPVRTLDDVAVTGIDRDPLAALMGAVVLSLSQTSGEVCVRDYISVSSEEVPDVDGVVCNPPFTSAESLPAATRTRLNETLESATERTISRKSPLSMYFVYHAQEFLSSGDRAAFLTRQNFLSRAYGTDLKRYLLEEFSVEALVRFDPEGSSVFESAETTTLITFVTVPDEDDEAGVNGDTRFISIDSESYDCPSNIPSEDSAPWQTDVVLDAITASESGVTNWGSINCVPQQALDPSENWETHFGIGETGRIDTSDLPRLSELATVSRGPITGKTELFCLSASDKESYAIGPRHLTRLLRSTSLIDGVSVNNADWEALQAADEEVWLVDTDQLPTVPDDVTAVTDTATEDVVSVDDARSNVAAYLLDRVRADELQVTKKLKQRRPWYDVQTRPPAQILVSDNGREFPFVLNEAGVAHLNGTHGITDLDLTEMELKALLAYLNSGIGQDIVSTRTQTTQGGQESLGVNAVKQLPVIDPRELSSEVVEALATAFDRMRTTTRDSQEYARIRTWIDSFLIEMA